MLGNQSILRAGRRWDGGAGRCVDRALLSRSLGTIATSIVGHKTCCFHNIGFVWANNQKGLYPSKFQVCISKKCPVVNVFTQRSFVDTVY